MACEVICCDVSQIIDGIVDGVDGDREEEGEGGNDNNYADKGEGSNELLDILFSLLDKPPPLPPRQAGYFEKVRHFVSYRQGL